MSVALGWSRVTMWFAEVGFEELDDFTDVRTMSLVRRSYVRVVSVYSLPNDAAEVTRRGLPAGSGMVHTYAWWVWPVTSASTFGLMPLAMSTIGPEMPSPAPGLSQL